MAKFNMVVPHALPQGEALRRIRGEIENLKREYGERVGDLRDSWRDDTYLFEGLTHGFAVSGVVLVKPSQIEIAANLPWLAMPFKGRIEAVIRERLSSLLG
jgi:predicted NBD/HSP70 family sugar kinase